MKEFVFIQTFFWFYIQRKFISVQLYQSYVARISIHACVWSAIMIFISSLWIVFFFLSEQLKIDRIEIIINWFRKKVVTSLKFKKNQNTIEKNKFYEWKIWRTIMKTMNENNFICIKINSWFHKISSAFFFIKRFFLSIIFFYHHHFNSWFSSDLIWLNEVSSALIFIIDFIQINISTVDFFLIKRKSRQYFFLSLIHTDQFFQ